MLLQMVFEKFSKAALLRQAQLPLATIRGSHKTASRMLHSLRRQPAVFALLGGAKVWEDVLWLVGALEAAHPQLAARHDPQLEYPWEDVHGAIQWPARNLQIAKLLSDSRKVLAPRVFRFAESVDQHFDAMFP